MYIIVYGDVVDGLTFFGPFPEEDLDSVVEAWSFGADGPWTFAELKPFPE